MNNMNNVMNMKDMNNNNMNNMMNMNNNMNMNNMNNNMNMNNMNNNINMNNNMHMMNMNNNFMNFNINNNFMNNINMNFGMNNMNMNNINMNFGMNNMNNFMGPPLMNPMFFPFNPINIFMKKEEGNKYLFRNIIKLNDKYFIVTSTRHKKINNDITHYCYLSLFDFNVMEEVSKLEICKIKENSILKFEFSMNSDENNIRINIICSRNYQYNLKFIENELILEKNN